MKNEGVLDQNRADEVTQNFEYFLLPMFHQKTGRHLKNIIILNSTSIEEGASALSNYNSLYAATRKSDRAQYDLLLLERVLIELNQSENLYFCCPIDYNTALSSQALENYKAKIRDVSVVARKRLRFIITNIPAGVPYPTLKKIIEPFSSYNVRILVFLPFDHNFDLSRILNCGFKGIGYIVNAENFIDEKTFKKSAEALVDKAKLYGLSTSIILDKTSSRIHEIAKTTGFDFICDTNSQSAIKI